MVEEKNTSAEVKKPTTADIKNKFANLKNLSADAAQAEKIITGANIHVPAPVQAEPLEVEAEALGKNNVAEGGAMGAILKKNRMSEMSGNSRLKKSNHEWLKALSGAENVGIEVLVNNILDLYFSQNKDEISKSIRKHLKKF